ncbi:solute carrier family 35 member C2 [Planococcus citri]|uniref:solute carrier family 35 member C2 n=1 Tax=Planococcus citri TaxID=170843 RepID=UPI0031F904AE
MAKVILKNSTSNKDNAKYGQNAEWLKLTVSTSFIIFVYFIFSIGLTFYQRWFLLKYKLPLTAVSCHLVIKYFLAAVFRRIFQCITGKKRISLNWTTNFTKLAPIGFAGGMDVAFSNWGLELITVSLYTMTKSTAIVFILLFALIFRLEKKSWGIFLIVFMISGGLFMFTYKSTQFKLSGFLLVLLASFISGLRWTLTQFVMQQSNLGLRNPIDMMYHIQLWMFLLIWPFSILMEGSLVVDEISVKKNTYELAVLVISGSLIAFALEVTEFLVVWHTSSLTFAVSGIVKEVCTVVLAVEWNGDAMTLVNFFGLLLCIGGVICHVIHKAQNVKDVHQKIINDEASAVFLPIPNDSSEEDIGNFDDDSSTEVLFNVLQIGEKPR